MKYTYYHQKHTDFGEAVSAMRFWINLTLDDPNQVLRAVAFDIEQDFDTKQTIYHVLVRGTPIVEKAA